MSRSHKYFVYLFIVSLDQLIFVIVTDEISLDKYFICYCVCFPNTILNRKKDTQQFLTTDLSNTQDSDIIL